jgi:predicted nucleic acid-binding protein
LGVVLDSSAVVALLLDEPSAGEVGSMLESAEPRMSTTNAAEVVDVLIRKHGGDPELVYSRVAELMSSVVKPVSPSLERSLRAGELRARHLDRRGRLSLADCFALATAEEEGGSAILTTDRILADAARAEGIEVVLLDS